LGFGVCRFGDLRFADSGIWGLEFGVEGLEFRVWGLGFRV